MPVFYNSPTASSSYYLAGRAYAISKVTAQFLGLHVTTKHALVSMSGSASAPPGLPDDFLAAYCPVLYLHQDDKFRPVSVEWFIQRSQLVHYAERVTGTGELHGLDKVPGGVKRLLPAGKVKQDNIIGDNSPFPCW